MASNRKYVVLRTREIRELLTPEEQQVLSQLIANIHTRRQQTNANARTPEFFTLNLSDKYALPALEAYVAAIDADEVNNVNAAVADARGVAFEARNRAIMQFDGSKLPG